MNEIFEEVAKILNIDVELVKTVVNTYMSYVKSRISKVSYKTLDSWDKVRTNFLLPGFGKLVIKNKSEKRLKHARSKS